MLLFYDEHPSTPTKPLTPLCMDIIFDIIWANRWMSFGENQ